MLILDEPTAVLTPQEAEGLFVTLRAMAAEGRTMIFISHKLHEVTAVADRVTVLRGGRSIGTVETAGATSQSLAALMVGRDVESARRPEGEHAIGEVVLELDGLSAVGDRGEEALRDVSLSVRAGEVLGIAGVAGNGQRELAEAVTGMRPLDGRHRARRRRSAAHGRPTRRDHGRHRPRARGPAPHRCRAEPEHRLEHRAEVVPHRRGRAVPPARRASATGPSS